MDAMSALTSQAARTDGGVAVTMLGKGLDSAKGQAAALLATLPAPPRVGGNGRLDGYA
ncbi:MAG: hypothetical protein QOG64_2061 [Acidimicrobiaceae bacterium]|jgi:hypothetical protein|nr:hypothetical protein [Acidimicrobiaceae bacterium]